MHTTILSGTLFNILEYFSLSLDKLFPLKLSILIYSKFSQPSNILFMDFTFEVSKFDKFNEVNDEQP